MRRICSCKDICNAHPEQGRHFPFQSCFRFCNAGDRIWIRRALCNAHVLDKMNCNTERNLSCATLKNELVLLSSQVDPGAGTFLLRIGEMVRKKTREIIEEHILCKYVWVWKSAANNLYC